MRKCCLILAVSVLLARPVAAEPDTEPAPAQSPTEETFRPERLWHFASLPGWWIAWLSAHEGSHALMAKYWDWDVVSFRPYPHTAIIDESGRPQFFWGATYLRCSQKTGLHSENGRYVDGPYWPACKDGGGLAAIALAPYVLDASVFAITDLVLSYEVDIDTFGGAMLFMGGMTGPWVNALFGSNFLTGGPDLASFSERTGTPKWATVLTFDAVMALGAWRLYVHGKDLIFDAPRNDGKRVWALTPTFRDGPGLSLALRW